MKGSERFLVSTSNSGGLERPANLSLDLIVPPDEAVYPVSSNSFVFAVVGDDKLGKALDLQRLFSISSSSSPNPKAHTPFKHIKQTICP